MIIKAYEKKMGYVAVQTKKIVHKIGLVTIISIKHKSGTQCYANPVWLITDVFKLGPILCFLVVIMQLNLPQRIFPKFDSQQKTLQIPKFHRFSHFSHSLIVQARR